MITLRLVPGNSPKGHEGEIICCAYTPDGQFLLSGGWDGRVGVWDTSSGMQVSSFRAGPKPVSACGAAPDGKTWWTGSMDGMLSAWDPISHHPKQTAVVHIRPISAVRFSPDGQTLATASWDRQVILRPAAGQGQARTLAGHGDIVSGCQFAPEGKQLLTWSHDRTLRLWEVDFARCAHVFQGHADRLVAAAISPDARWLVSASRDGALKLWDVPQRVETTSVRLGELRSCCFLRDRESLLVADVSGWALVLSVPGLEIKAELGTSIKVQTGDLSPSGGHLALGGDDGRMHFVEILGTELTPMLIQPTQAVPEKSSVLGRLFGMGRPQRKFQYSCPQCRQVGECEALPEEPFPCGKCGRSLRFGPFAVAQPHP
jgi:WD40 repeat protein